MLTKYKWFMAACAAVLMLALMFTACGGDTGSPASVDPVVPTITEQPQGGTYTLGEANAKLTVTASKTDDGVLGYQWYIVTADEDYANGGGDPLGEGSEYTLSSELEEGAHRIYVLVTNTKGTKTASVKSALVTVIINDPGNAPYPDITAQPASSAYDWAGSSITPDPVSVTVAPPTQGALSYQWYSSDTYSSTGGTAIPGETAASYQPPAITTEGTFYYYVIVTNKWPEAPKRQESPVTSSLAVIKAITANATITVNSATKYQYVRGFGGMAPFWSNSPDASLADYEKMFNPETGLGLNMLRIMIPVSPTGTNIRTTMNRALNNELSGAKDRTNYYDMVKLVNKYGGFVLASPWSPPPSWKTNKDIRGGGAGNPAKLLTQFYADYADYLKEYCKIMYEKGAPIYAVSIQNEPNFAASYDGCEWDDNDMRDFMILAGSFTDGVKGWGGGAEISRVLIMNGESANSPTINDAVLNSSDARKFVDLYARHLYGSQQVSRSTQVQALGKEIWMTEHNINGGNEDVYPLDSTYNYLWKFLNDVDVSIRLNSENAFVWWYAKRFYSFIGEGDYGTVDGAILPRGWALSHYAKYASNTDRIALTITGTTAGGGAITTGTNFNNTSFDIDSTAVRATAFMAKDGNSISVILFTPTNTGGTGGTNMGNIKIEFPSGFTATKVTAMRTRSGSLGQPDTDTVLLKGGNAALVNLPAGQILSVKFTK